ncbi:hypothetical protein QJS66_16170 [Kocuria rhizophila]|nr:hypothetical protein QJS66_16170 [Kocuria rhizophila]
MTHEEAGARRRRSGRGDRPAAHRGELRRHRPVRARGGPQRRARPRPVHPARRASTRRNVHRARARGQAMTAQEPVDQAGQRGLVINTASVAALRGRSGRRRTRRPRAGCTP